MFGDPVANERAWVTQKLGDVAGKITDGTHKTPGYLECGIPFLSAKDLKNGGVVWDSGKFISIDEHLELSKRCDPRRGDILLAKSGSLGDVAIVDRDHEFSLFESLCLIKHDREQLDGVFLLHALRNPSLRAHLLGKNKGVAIRHLHLVDIRSLLVPVPPISIQQDFAKRISGVGRMRSAGTASLSTLDALFSSLQHRAFRGEL